MAAQVGQNGGVEAQSQQEPCLPEDEPCGGGGTGSVTVLPDGGSASVLTNSTGNVAEFQVINGYASGYSYNLSCSTTTGLTCTAIKNPAGTTISSIYLGASGSSEIMVHFSANATPGLRTIRLIATNGIVTDTGYYSVTVSAPPPPPAPAAVTAT